MAGEGDWGPVERLSTCPLACVADEFGGHYLAGVTIQIDGWVFSFNRNA